MPTRSSGRGSSGRGSSGSSGRGSSGRGSSGRVRPVAGRPAGKRKPGVCSNLQAIVKNFFKFSDINKELQDFQITYRKIIPPEFFEKLEENKKNINIIDLTTIINSIDKMAGSTNAIKRQAIIVYVLGNNQTKKQLLNAVDSAGVNLVIYQNKELIAQSELPLCRSLGYAGAAAGGKYIKRHTKKRRMGTRKPGTKKRRTGKRRTGKRRTGKKGKTYRKR